MVVWLNIAWWGYIALWAVLLIHCLLKKRFFPLFGRELGTKIFWIITFIFVDPLLTLLYVIFGVFSRADETNVRKIHVRGAICLVLVLVVIGVFHLPRLDRNKDEITILQAGQEQPKKSGAQAQVGALQSNNSHTTATSELSSGNAKFSPQSIVIRTESDHILIDKVCRFMQEKIFELPYVERVEYWPSGVEMNDPLSKADIIITLDVRRINEGGFGIKRKLDTDILCDVGTDPVERFHNWYYKNTPPVLRFSMNSSLRHSSIFKGFESGRARYKQQSEDIGKQFVEAITKQFDKWVEKYGLMTELPEYMFGKGGTDVAFEFLKEKNARRIHHSGGLVTNYSVFWSFEDERTNDEVFREVRDVLYQKGWSGGKQLDRQGEHEREFFTMSKGDEHMQIFRKRGRSNTGGLIPGDSRSLEKKLPIIVEYFSLFTDEQINDVLGKLFTSDADIDTKLLFENFKTDESVKQLLFDSVESQQVKTMDGHLMIGRFYANRDQMARAKEALMMARAMSWAESEHNPASNEIKKLAKKIGDEELAKSEITLEYYQRAGFIDISTLEDGNVYERGVDEPLMFYTIPSDVEGAEKAKIETVVVRVSEMNAKEDEYEVVRIKKQCGSSSVSKSGLSKGLSHFNPLGRNDSFTLTIEKLEGKKFKFTVQM